MLKIFRRQRVKHPEAPSTFAYHQGDVFNPGASSFAYEPTTTTMPPTLIKGPGILAGSLGVTQPQPFFQNLALQTEPQQGWPVGSFGFTGLMDQEPTD